MKYRGSRVFFCKTCKKSYHYIVDVEYEKDKDGKVVLGITGKPKIKNRKLKVRTWKSSR